MVDCKIRLFKAADADYQAVVAISNLVWPDGLDTVESLRHRDLTWDSKYLFQRLVAEVDGRIVAAALYCEPPWSYRPGKFFINGSVHPAMQRQGIGAAIYDHIMEILTQRNLASINAHTREDKTDAIAFLARRGFGQVLREPISRLEVVNFDATRFASTTERVQQAGIQIRNLSEIGRTDAEWKRKYYELDWELMQDVPTPDVLTKPDFEVFEKRVFGSPGFDPDGNLIALDGERWVGVTSLWTNQAEPDKRYTGLTGVARSHRRKGIATALKVRAIGYARRCGARIIETDNEENNPMYQLNIRLGFEAQPAWLQFEKKIVDRNPDGAAV